MDEVLKTIEQSYEHFLSMNERIEVLINEQLNKLKQKIVEVEPLIDFYLSRHLVFTHPTINHRTVRGPIIGFDNDFLYVLDLENKNFAIKVDVLNEREDKRITLINLIEVVGFKNAILGLEYLKEMMTVYARKAQDTVDKLEDEINNI